MALEMRPTCESCGTALAPDSEKAMICSYECTFCTDCAHRLGQCPNCGGGFAPRPTRVAQPAVGA